MFNWNKKEAPLKALAGLGGGVGRGGGPSASATGGTKFISGNQTYHLFHNNSTLVVDGSVDLIAEIFLVAGGGSGFDGGGGAGGIRNVPNVTLTAGETWVCTVGGGGASTGSANSSTNRPGWNSSNAQSNPIVGKHTDFYFQPVSYSNPKYYRALGGGRGGSWANDGGPGGSGGGAGNRSSPGRSGGVANSDNGTPNPGAGQFGNAGGGCNGSPVNDIGGGGGGAGSGGTSGSSPEPTTYRGNGGDGAPFPAYASPIIGPQLTVAGVPGPEVTAFNTAVGPTGMYGGGGGGGGRNPGDNTGTAGGAGGGGNYLGSSPYRGTPGIKYTGGGGGGGGLVEGTGYGPGGGGGTGLIIIKYPT